MCRAPSFSRYSLFVEVPPSPPRKRPRPARCITPVRRAQPSRLPLARTGVGRAPGSSAACHAGLVGTWWWRDAVLRGGAGRGGGKPADRLDRIGSGRVGRLAVGGSLVLVFPLPFSLGPRGKAGKRPARRRRGSDVALLGVGGGVGGVGDGWYGLERVRGGVAVVVGRLELSRWFGCPWEMGKWSREGVDAGRMYCAC